MPDDDIFAQAASKMAKAAPKGDIFAQAAAKMASSTTSTTIPGSPPGGLPAVPSIRAGTLPNPMQTQSRYDLSQPYTTAQGPIDPISGMSAKQIQAQGPPGKILPVIGGGVGGALGGIPGAALGGIVGEGLKQSIEPTANPPLEMLKSGG